MRIPRRYWRNLDWPLILSVLALTVIGLVVIYSASYTQLVTAGMSPLHYVRSQVVAFSIGLAIAIIIVSIDYRGWESWARFVFLGPKGLFACLFFKFVGRADGARWVL